MAFNLPEDAISKITLKPREPNKGTPQSILEAANRNIAFINWEQEPLGLTIDKEVSNPDGTKTIYFTSNCDLKSKYPLDWDILQAQVKLEAIKHTKFEQLKKRPIAGNLHSYFISPDFVPRVAQHDLDTCCGTTASAKENLLYVKELERKVLSLEDKVKFMDNLIEAYQCDTLYQFARHVSMLSVRCEVLTQQVNQLKGN